MIGSYVIYQGVFRDRLAVRQITGETEKFWTVRHTRHGELSRIKKSSLGPHAFFDTEINANRFAREYTDRLIKARCEFIELREAILNELNRLSETADDERDSE